jgi:antitoxin HigA-1
MPRPKNYPRRDPNRCPTHPGAVLREIVFPELRVSKTAIADAMKISRNQLYLILGERQPVTPDTAVRLAADMGGSPRSMPLVKRSQFHWVGRSLLKSTPDREWELMDRWPA